MIMAFKSPNADSRTATNLTPENLMNDTKRHIEAVSDGMDFIADLIKTAGSEHDDSKMSHFMAFYDALKSNKIKESAWYKDHIRERHHLKSYVPTDVNLIDVIHHLVDCTMAGLTRSGEIYDVDLSTEILKKACENTVELLKKNVKVVEAKEE